MLHYIIRSPRGFANETSIYSYDPSNADEAKAVDEMLASETGWAKRITRKEAESITAANRREGGSPQNPVGAKHIDTMAEYLSLYR